MALSPLLVDAKKEYTHQLADLLAPYVMNTIARIFETAKKKTQAFREALRSVPNWNASIIDERTHEIERRNPQLQDLIAACCVSYTKVLGSIRLNHSQHSNVRIALPQSSAFVHGVYVHVAKEFFYDPKLVFADRRRKIELLQDAVDESIRQHVPIQQLLRAYLSVAVDDQGMDPMAATNDADPDPGPGPDPEQYPGDHPGFGADPDPVHFQTPQPAYMASPPPPAPAPVPVPYMLSPQMHSGAPPAQPQPQYPPAQPQYPPAQPQYMPMPIPVPQPQPQPQPQYPPAHDMPHPLLQEFSDDPGASPGAGAPPGRPAALHDFDRDFA